MYVYFLSEALIWSVCNALSVRSTLNTGRALIGWLSLLIPDWQPLSSNHGRVTWDEGPIACPGGRSSERLVSSRLRCCIWTWSTERTVTAATLSPPRPAPLLLPRCLSPRRLSHLLPWIPTGPRDPRRLTCSPSYHGHRWGLLLNM